MSKQNVYFAAFAVLAIGVMIIGKNPKPLPTRYTWSGATTGGITITQSSTSPSLQPGDTLDMPANGNWNSVSFNSLVGSLGNNIVIRFLSGSVITTTNAGFTGSWNNVSFVKVLNMTTRNYAGNPLWFRATVHDVVFDSCSFTNDPGSFPDKNCMRWDDNTVNTMDFDGNKATTFYNVEIKNSVFNGFKNTNCITMGSDGIRSICTDFNIHHNTFKNIVNDVHLSAILLEGTCFNFKFMYNRVDSILLPIVLPTNGVHVGIITTFGYGEVAYNYFTNMYSNTCRVNVLVWPFALGGAYANGKMLIHHNIDAYHRSFSSYEITNNNSGTRIAALGLDTAETIVYNNTTHHTRRDSYNGDYHGCIVDLITHHVHVYNNVITRPEWDRAFDPDASQSRYVVAYISGDQFDSDTSHNRQAQSPLTLGSDTTSWKLLAGSPLRGAGINLPSLNQTDYYGHTPAGNPAIGAYEYFSESNVPIRRGRRKVSY